MQLQRIERLDIQEGDIIIVKATDVNNDQLAKLFQQLHEIKSKHKKDVNFIVLTNEWSKLIDVQITDVKGRLFEVDKLIKQLIRMSDGLINKLKIQGTADQLTKKVLQNLEYMKQQRGG